MAYARTIAIIASLFAGGFLIAAGADDWAVNLIRAIGFGTISGLAWCVVYCLRAHREVARLTSIHRGELAAFAELLDDQADRLAELEQRAATNDVQQVMDTLQQRRAAGMDNVVSFERHASPDS